MRESLIVPIDRQPIVLNGGPAVTEVWEEPVPFAAAVLDVPAFPLDVLPSWMRAMVGAVSEMLEVPPEIPALYALGALSAALAPKVSARIEQGPTGWNEPVQLYLLAAYESGGGKSPAMAAMTRPVHAWLLEETERKRPAVRAARLALRDLEKDRERAQKALEGAPEEKKAELRARVQEIVENIVAAEEHMPTVPPPITRDATPEALAVRLSEGAVSVFSAEGEFFQSTLGGRYSDGRPNCELVLSAHDGESYRADRKGTEAMVVRRPVLTVAISVQPDVLSEFLSRKELHANGLLARFLLMVPPSTVGYRTHARKPVQESVSKAYEANLRVLLGLPQPARDEPPPALVFEPAAGQRLYEMKRELEPRMREGADLHHIRSFANKLAGTTARIAALLHCSSEDAIGYAVPSGGKPSERPPWTKEVSLATVEKAAELASFFLEHTRAASGLAVGTRRHDDARALLARLEAKGLRHVTRREACRLAKGISEKPGGTERIDRALSELERRGYLRPLSVVTAPGRGRPRGRTYEVYPGVARVGEVS